MTLVILPTTQIPASKLMDLVIDNDIFDIVFYEHPHWFSPKMPFSQLVFLRASMQNTYDDYYDSYHDEKTQFRYIECDEKLPDIEKPFVIQDIGLIQNAKKLGNFPIKVPKTERRKLPFPAVLSPKSKLTWLSADSYIREKLNIDGAIPTIMPTWQPDIRKSLKKLKIGKDEYCPYYNLLCSTQMIE